MVGTHEQNPNHKSYEIKENVEFTRPINHDWNLDTNNTIYMYLKCQKNQTSILSFTSKSFLETKNNLHFFLLQWFPK